MGHQSDQKTPQAAQPIYFSAWGSRIVGVLEVKTQTQKKKYDEDGIAGGRFIVNQHSINGMRGIQQAGQRGDSLITKHLLHKTEQHPGAQKEQKQINQMISDGVTAEQKIIEHDQGVRNGTEIVAL